MLLGVLLGLALRLRQYAFDRSLWGDELALTQNVVHRGFGELTRPLAEGQAAPVGFLWLEHAAVRVFGNNEMALRLVPVVGSVMALLIFAAVARRVLPAPAAAVAVFLFATTPQLLFYSSEVKQYSTDVTATVLLVSWTLLLGGRPTWRTAGLWGLGSALLIWLSQPAIPVAACCCLVVVVRTVRRPRDLLPLLPGGALLGASLALEYAISLRQQSANVILQLYWSAGYPPRPLGLHSTLGWLHGAVGSVLADPMALRVPDLAVALGVFGAVVLLVRHRGAAVGLLTAPLALAVLLAADHLYPLQQRLALYLLPLVVLLLAAALAFCPPVAARGRRARRARLAALLGAVAVVAGLLVVTGSGVARGVSVLGRPIDITAGRQAVAFVAAHQRPGDVVLGERLWSTGTLAYYGHRYGVHATGSVGFSPIRGRCDPAAQLGIPAGASRVWLVLDRNPAGEPADRNAVLVSDFEQVGTLVSSYTGAGDAGAYLFDVTTPPVSPPPLLPSWMPGACLTGGPVL